WRPRTRRLNIRSAPCSITCSCIRPSSGRKRSSSSKWPATIPTSSSAALAAGRTSPALPCPSSACSCGAAASAASLRSSRRPAPEANHAVRCAIDEALRCKKEGKSETILFNMSGHGHFDMQAYISYFEGKLVDQDYDQKELAMALAGLPAVAA